MEILRVTSRIRDEVLVLDRKCEGELVAKRNGQSGHGWQEALFRYAEGSQHARLKDLPRQAELTNDNYRKRLGSGIRSSNTLTEFTPPIPS